MRSTFCVSFQRLKTSVFLHFFLNAAYKGYALVVFSKRFRTLLLSFLKLFNISSTLFVVCLLLNALFLVLSANWICKCVSRMYLVSIEALNRQDRSSFLLWKSQKPWSPLSSCHVAFKNINQTFLLPSKLLNTLAGLCFMYFKLFRCETYILSSTSNFKNIIRTCSLVLSFLVILYTVYFEVFKC